MIDTKFVREVFDYDGKNLIWKVRRQRIKVGSVAGYLHHSGYRYIKIHGKLYGAHRLVWLYHYGAWPNPEADHINRIPSDNRIENLREATHAEQQQNRSFFKNNTSGHIGVYWFKPSKKWHAQIMVDGKSIHLGYFDDFDAACAAREEAKKKYHPFGAK